MYRHLFFICPTDNLESVINSSFEHENYFFTSLGNSMVFKMAEVGQIIELVVKKNIDEITFVLSDNNRIVSDAIENQEFSEISGLKNFYSQIKNEKMRYELLVRTKNERQLVLSYHLSSKINELSQRLKNLMVNEVKINGKIYNHKTKEFTEVYSGLICLEQFNLN